MKISYKFNLMNWHIRHLFGFFMIISGSLIIYAFPCMAGTFHSKFGFSIILPPHWVIVSPDTLKNNPNLFNFDNPRLNKMEPEFKENIKSIVSSGAMEYFINQDTANNICIDSITITKDKGDFPRTKNELEDWKESMPKILSRKMGVPIIFNNLELKTINGLEFLFTEFSAPSAGIQYLQYAIQNQNKETIAITANFYVKNIDRIRLEMIYIIESFHFENKNTSKN